MEDHFVIQYFEHLKIISLYDLLHLMNLQPIN